VKCLRDNYSCDLASLDIVRWRRFKKQRQKLKEELRKTNAKQQRLLYQLNYLEEKQQTIINNELKNLKKMILLSSFVDSFFLSLLINVISKQIVFLNIIKEWSFTFLISFDEIVANNVSNASNS